MSSVKLSEVIAPHFFDIHREIKQHVYTEYVLKGGRGSTKSSFIAVEILLLIKRNPNMHALCCRQVKDTLHDSVYSQLLWAIDILGLGNEFKCTKSPLEMIYTPTGQKIYFRGADNPYKIKSIKPRFGYIGILWFEELDQFCGCEAIRSVEQSVKRGGDKFYVFKSFNPPVTAANWANDYVLENNSAVRTHHSTYLSVPREWLGEAFIYDAEHLKKSNERAYRHEYLGEVVGTGGNVFENVECREITQAELDTLDREYKGIDWGWYPDPYVYVDCRYDSARRTLYIIDEYRTNKQTNKQTSDALKARGITGTQEILADSSDPKSIADYRDYGLLCRGAEKGPGSVDYSMKWLAGLNRIVIDNGKCLYCAKEFLNYEYERTRTGEVISGYPDRDNHAIDAVRYALNRVWKRRGQ